MAAESVDDDEKYLYGDVESPGKTDMVTEDKQDDAPAIKSDLRADAPEFTSKIHSTPVAEKPEESSEEPKANAVENDTDEVTTNHTNGDDSQSHTLTDSLDQDTAETTKKTDEDGDEEEDDDEEDDDEDDDDDVQVTIGEITQVGSGFRDSHGSTVNWKSNQVGQAATGAATPASSKGVDINAVGQVNGTSVYEYDFDTGTSSLDEKPWRKPGADISDYFNYGFTEDTWKQYCEKQRGLRGSNAIADKRLLPVSSAASSATAQPPPEMEVLPDGRTRLKAGPPPDRQVEGSISVIGGENSRVDSRRREEEEMMLQSMRQPPPGFNPMFPPGMPRPMYRQIHPGMPPPFFPPQPMPMDPSLSMPNPAMSTASSMPNSHGPPVRPNFADPMAGMFPPGMPGQMPPRGMPGPPDPFMPPGGLPGGLPFELGTFREQFPSPERESDYDSENHDNRPPRRRRDKEPRHREIKDRERGQSRDRERDRERERPRDRERERERRPREKEGERDRERPRTKDKDKSRPRRSEHSKDRKSESGSSSRKKHSRSSSSKGGEEQTEESDQPKKKSRKARTNDEAKASKESGEAKAE